MSATTSGSLNRAEVRAQRRKAAKSTDLHGRTRAGADEVSRARRVEPDGSRGGRRAEPGEESDDPLERARRATGAAEFAEALDLLRTLRGLSFQQVSANAGKHNLPKSTAHLLCRKETLPKKPDQVTRFVVACGESEQQADAWVAQWRRLVCRERKGREPAQSAVRDLPVTPRPQVREVPEPVAAAEPDRRPTRWWRRFLTGGQSL